MGWTKRDLDDLNEKYLPRMKELLSGWDTERKHIDADTILCELLTELGFAELVAAFDDLDKWYA